MSEWQPIETCEVDNVEVLLWSPKFGMRVDLWRNYHRINQPAYSHWMPLPAPPVCSVKEEK